MKKLLVVGALALVVIAAGVIIWPRIQQQQALADLATRTKAGMIAVPGGEFQAGNYQAAFLDSDGVTRTRWVIEPELALPPYTVALDDFQLQSQEVSNADFNLFLHSRGLAPLPSDIELRLNLPNHAAQMSWQEAEAYCDWLGTIADLPLRLPTEAEWEAAARSRLSAPPWATDDGSYHEGRNIPLRDRNQPKLHDPAIATLPPNPSGFYDMAAGLYEWVSDRAPSDPADSHVFKGGSNSSTILREVIPSRGVAQPAPDAVIQALSKQQALRLEQQSGRMHLAAATVRCAMNAPADEPAPQVLAGPFGVTNSAR